MSDQDNFSLQYQYHIKQTSDENKEKYQLGDYKLIQYQILQTNIMRTVWQTVRRTTKEILGVKGLKMWERGRLFILNSQDIPQQTAHTKLRNLRHK